MSTLHASCLSFPSFTTLHSSQSLGSQHSTLPSTQHFLPCISASPLRVPVLSFSPPQRDLNYDFASQALSTLHHLPNDHTIDKGIFIDKVIFDTDTGIFIPTDNLALITRMFRAQRQLRGQECMCACCNASVQWPVSQRPPERCLGSLRCQQRTVKPGRWSLPRRALQAPL